MRQPRELILNVAEQEHCARMREYLAGEIAAAHGWLRFERFMDLALYTPGLGYYSCGTQKLGEAADFTTAPEIGSLFGACVAAQCAEVLAALDDGSILEIGAGSGRLAADVLGRLEDLKCLPAQYWILEISADLRERQHRLLESRLPHLLGRVRWLESPVEKPFDGVVIANEVLDALPVARFRWHAGAVEEFGVVIEDERFAWSARQSSEGFTAACRRLNVASGWQDGYLSEYCPRLAAWTHAVTRHLRRGAALWFDYGLPRAQYYFPERRDGTLLCHFRQRAHDDPLRYPGLQDITAWVDFTALAEAARAAGFQVAGFTTQAFFLAGLGIDRQMQRIAGGDTRAQARLGGEARRLMLPGEMGERFKAMAWLKGLDMPLSGFGLQDLRHSL